MNRRKKKSDKCKRIKKTNLRGFVENYEPTMRRSANTSAMRRERKIEEMGFASGDVEEGLVRKKEAWELRWEIERGFGDGR